MKLRIVVLILSVLVVMAEFVGAQEIVQSSADSIHKMHKKASIDFIGTFYTGKGPCQEYAKGKTRWRLINGFKITNDFVGNIKAKEIEITPYMSSDSLSSSLINKFNLIEGEQYRVSLNPLAEKFKFITENNIIFNYYEHLITDKEIIAITKIE